MGSGGGTRHEQVRRRGLIPHGHVLRIFEARRLVRHTLHQKHRHIRQRFVSDRQLVARTQHATTSRECESLTSRVHEQAVAYLVLSVLPLKLYGASCGVHVSTRLNIWQFIGRCHGPAKACEKWCQCEHGSLHSNLQHRRVVLGKHSCVFEHHVSCTRRTHNRRAATQYSCSSLLGPARLEEK